MNGLKFVFCEGGDDEAVVRGITASVGMTGIRVEQFLGRSNLGNFLKAVRVRPEFTQNLVSAIGIIRDADENADAAFKSVCAALETNDFTAPSKNGGFSSGGIKVGVLVVGPNNGAGMIEDLCLQSVSQRPEFPCLADYFDCVTRKSTRKQFSSKARVRAWMATQEDHSYYVGKAAEHGYWDWTSPAFDSLREFLRQL